MTSAPAVIDVSKLPSSALDHRSTIWWGNALLLCIETSMFAVVAATYFYLRRNFEQWPPPKVNALPIIHHPLPLLTIPTINLAVMLISLIPMIICDRACLKMNEKVVRITALIGFLLGVACIVLRFKEFASLQFRWDDNAYGSITWVILGVHLMHLLALTIEDGLMSAWVLINGLDDKHARDIRVTAVYWYWVVGIWLIMYAIVYWSPRMF
jgi:heme/copper-type cytochrome/quinol oxidase subunit 3